MAGFCYRSPTPVATVLNHGQLLYKLILRVSVGLVFLVRDWSLFAPGPVALGGPFDSHLLKAPEAFSGAQCRRKERRGGVRSELELLRAEPRSAIARAGAYVPPRTVS